MEGILIINGLLSKTYEAGDNVLLYIVMHYKRNKLKLHHGTVINLAPYLYGLSCPDIYCYFI